MLGPDLITRSISALRIPDAFGNAWQYHSRSDRHSKIACWAVLFDVLQRCPLLQEHIAVGKVGFGINHTLTQFDNNRPKNLDLVLCTPRETSARGKEFTFADMAAQYELLLTAEEQAKLEALPRLMRRPVGRLLSAMEAKACMTEHRKAAPRLYDELDSSLSAIHGSASDAVAVGFLMVNAAPTFRSTDNNKFPLDQLDARDKPHKQPGAVEWILSKITQLPQRKFPTQEGFDAFGILTVNARNDGSPWTVAPAPPALKPGDAFHYETMVQRIVAIYSSRFATL